MRLPVLERPKGITLYCPYIPILLNKTVRLYINRYERKPSINLLNCTQSQLVLAELEGVMKKEGIIFSYKTNLEKGFYRLEVISEGKRGNELYPILHGEESLIVGLTYSAYPSIDLS